MTTYDFTERSSGYAAAKRGDSLSMYNWRELSSEWLDGFLQGVFDRRYDNA